MKKLVLVWFVVLSLAGSAFASPAQDLFDQATFYLEFQYFGPSTVNLKELIATYQQRLTNACQQDGETCGYDKSEPLLEELFDALNDGHAYYFPAEPLQRYLEARSSGESLTPKPMIGFSRREFRNAQGELLSPDFLITEVTAGSPAARIGLQFGDRWIGYNDVLFSSFGDEKNADGKHAQFIKEFSVHVQAAEQVTLNIVRGLKRERLNLSLKGEIFNSARFPSLRMLEGNVAVIRHPDFSPLGNGNRFHELVRAASARNARVVILDMRRNPGGAANEFWSAAGALIANPAAVRLIPRYNPDQDSTVYGWDAQRKAVYVQNTNGQKMAEWRVEKPAFWDGPLTVLVDESCASACEYLSALLQKAQRAKVIGTLTAGVGNTDTRRFVLINGAAASMPTIRSHWLDGGLLPATITPDILVPNNLEELFDTGRDTMLERALEILKP
jgi:carboxyl-terminal processing protease